MLTVLAGGAGVGRVGAVAHVAAALLDAAAAVVAEAGRVAAVPGAAGAHARGQLGPLVQVQVGTIHSQSPHAAQEALLSGCRPPLKTEEHVSILKYYVLFFLICWLFGWFIGLYICTNAVCTVCVSVCVCERASM